MSGSTSPGPARRSRAPSYRPVALIGMVYVVVLFFVFELLLILPELSPILESVPAGPAQEALAEEVAREAAPSRMPYAIVLAVLTTALGAYFRVLPGLRP